MDYDPTDRVKATHYLAKHAAAGEVVTELLYVNPRARDLHEYRYTVETLPNKLDVRELCPGSVALERINAALRLIPRLAEKRPFVSSVA